MVYTSNKFFGFYKKKSAIIERDNNCILVIGQ